MRELNFQRIKKSFIFQKTTTKNADSLNVRDFRQGHYETNFLSPSRTFNKWWRGAYLKLILESKNKSEIPSTTSDFFFLNKTKPHVF